MSARSRPASHPSCAWPPGRWRPRSPESWREPIGNGLLGLESGLDGSGRAAVASAVVVARATSRATWSTPTSDPDRSAQPAPRPHRAVDQLFRRRERLSSYARWAFGRVVAQLSRLAPGGTVVTHASMRKMTAKPTTVSRPRSRRPARASVVSAATGSRESKQVLAALRGLRIDVLRFALSVAEALPDVADEAGMSERQVRNLLSRLVRAGLLQQRKAPHSRQALARALGPSLVDLDPVPRATVEQARRLAGLRASLLRQGALTTAAIAKARRMAPNNARQWLSRHRRAHRLFTVRHEGETLVPAFLLDEEFEPTGRAVEAIRALRRAGEDGWALWAWFATPSAWLGGRLPADVLKSDPELVAKSARQRAESAA